MVRDKPDKIEDGADESMLAGQEKEQLARKDEVKFISGDRTNGDAKIDIGNIDKGFTGMTKEELMKYANDPFWVRLRWIFFILFWGLWIAMLAGAILIIFKAPKCSAPVPLPWYKQGPIVQLPAINTDPHLIERLKLINAKGVIYKLPDDKTYAVDSEEVKMYVQNLVAEFKNTSINVILDLTPNYVTTENELYKKALNDSHYRDAFVWNERARTPNNWLSKSGTGAWKEVLPHQFVLSQFGTTNIDLQFNSTIVKNMFKNVLLTLTKLGVKGFRLVNAKHYIINKDDMSDDSRLNDPTNQNPIHTEYNFWSHRATTNQPGLGDLLHEFWQVVQNGTNGEGFLTVAEKIDNIKVFKTSNGNIGFDLPIVTVLPYAIKDGGNLSRKLSEELTSMVKTLGPGTWAQLVYDRTALEKSGIGESEFNHFIFLLPGVPVATLEEFTGKNSSNVDEIRRLELLRDSPSYQHGSFDVYTDLTDQVIAYSRIKSGNPGYFVAFNPTSLEIAANFSAIGHLPSHLTVDTVSQRFNVSGINKGFKVPTDNIILSPNSTIILTYAPKSD